MAITKRPQPSSEAVEKFIQGAPDAKAIPTGISAYKDQDGSIKNSYDTGPSEQITLRIPKEQLDRITKMAQKQGIPRSNYIKRAIMLQLAEDEKA